MKFVIGLFLWQILYLLTFLIMSSNQSLSLWLMNLSAITRLHSCWNKATKTPMFWQTSEVTVSIPCQIRLRSRKLKM